MTQSSFAARPTGRPLTSSLRLAGAALTLLALSACGSGQWVRPDATMADVDHDLYQCERETAAMYPPVMVEHSYSFNHTTETSDCKQRGNSLKCTTTTSGPDTTMVDGNAGRRKEAQGACMRARGYYWREDQ